MASKSFGSAVASVLTNPLHRCTNVLVGTDSFRLSVVGVLDQRCWRGLMAKEARQQESCPPQRDSPMAMARH
jgi:hypothetical protein